MKSWGDLHEYFPIITGDSCLWCRMEQRPLKFCQAVIGTRAFNGIFMMFVWNFWSKNSWQCWSMSFSCSLFPILRLTLGKIRTLYCFCDVCVSVNSINSCYVYVYLYPSKTILTIINQITCKCKFMYSNFLLSVVFEINFFCHMEKNCSVQP